MNKLLDLLIGSPYKGWLKLKNHRCNQRGREGKRKENMREGERGFDYGSTLYSQAKPIKIACRLLSRGIH